MSRPSRDDLARFLREIDSGGGGVAPLDRGGARASYATAFCPSERAAELADLAHRPPPGFTVYKFGSRSVVGSFTLSDGFSAVLKYYYPKSLYKHLTYGIAGSRCRRSWMAALAFEYVGIPTPAPLAIAEWQQFGGLWLSKSFLATSQAPGISLDRWVDRHAGDQRRLEEMADRLRGLFSRMAEYRISHGDLKANNLMIGEDDSVSLIDLDSVSFCQSGSRWTTLRARDVRIFNDNWKRKPAVATIFTNLFGNRHSA